MLVSADALTNMELAGIPNKR